MGLGKHLNKRNGSQQSEAQGVFRKYHFWKKESRSESGNMHRCECDNCVTVDCSRACLKNHSQSALTLRDFAPNSVVVARYGALIRQISPQIDVHLTRKLFQTCRQQQYCINLETKEKIKNFKKVVDKYSNIRYTNLVACWTSTNVRV